MNLAVLAIVLVFMIYLRIGIKWSDKTFKKTQEGYRQREEDANFTRRKSLDDLDYVTIPPAVGELIKRFDNDELTALLDENTKIVNLNGISNTDLKLKYGAPNINILSEYDKNFETLVKGLQDMVSEETGDMFNTDEKISILEALAQAGDLTIYGVRDRVKLIREDATGKKEIHVLNLNDANIINSPYFYLQQNDVIYVEPNKVKAQNSSIGSVTTSSLSAASILVSIATLVISVMRR